MKKSGPRLPSLALVESRLHKFVAFDTPQLVFGKKRNCPTAVVAELFLGRAARQYMISQTLIDATQDNPFSVAFIRKLLP